MEQYNAAKYKMFSCSFILKSIEYNKFTNTIEKKMDILYQIVELLKKIEWNNLLSSLFGAGFGALSAYWLSYKKERNINKCNEKALLIKLFYDINISGKTLCCYYSNIISEIKHYSKKSPGYEIPISLDVAKLNLNSYGFIAKKSPQLYEILTYLNEDICYIINDNNILTQEMDYRSKAYQDQLYNILMQLPKSIAKVYASLYNVNVFLIKYYDTDNLLKEHVLNATRRMKKVFKITFHYYKGISSKKDFKSNILDTRQIKRYRNLLRPEMNYIDEILNKWFLDFKLSKKQTSNMLNLFDIKI